MLKVYGTNGCGKCIVIKRKLEHLGEEFEYTLIEDLPEDRQEEILNKAESEGVRTFPLVFNDEGIVKGEIL